MPCMQPTDRCADRTSSVSAHRHVVYVMLSCCCCCCSLLPAVNNTPDRSLLEMSKMRVTGVYLQPGQQNIKQSREHDIGIRTKKRVAANSTCEHAVCQDTLQCSSMRVYQTQMTALCAAAVPPPRPWLSPVLHGDSDRPDSSKLLQAAWHLPAEGVVGQIDLQQVV